MRAHFVTFHSPGAFVHETSERPIASWDPALAIEMARGITERHSATPFAFTFTTKLVADPVDDGEGGTLDVQPRALAKSGRFYLGGRLVFLSELEANPTNDLRILRENMRGNGWPVVIENTNSYRVTQPFDADDVLLDLETGAVVRLGSDPEIAALRAALLADRERQYAEFAAARAARPPGHSIHHIDGDPTNNSLENIQYVEGGHMKTASPWTQITPTKWARTIPGPPTSMVGWVEERPYGSGQWAAEADAGNGLDIVQAATGLLPLEQVKAAVDAWLVAHGWTLEGT